MKKRILSLMLAAVMVLSLAACGGGDSNNDETVAGTNGGAVESTDGGTASTAADTYTYRGYVNALATNWNPHTWESSADSFVLATFLSTALVSSTVKDSENSEFQFVFDAATGITDVTADHQDDLTTYGVTLPANQTAEEQTWGYVFEIALNPDMAWEDGTPINADTYLYSYQQELNPDMKNYRANNDYFGDTAIAGASKYFYSKDEGLYVTATDPDNTENLYIDAYDFWNASAEYTDADGNALPQYVSVLDETVYGENVDDAFSGAQLYADYYSYLVDGGLYEYQTNEDFGATFDQVGVYKVDDYTIRIVTQMPVEYNYFLYHMTSTPLVYEPLYEACKTQTGDLVTSTYGTTVETTMSYGPYKFASMQEGKQMVFVQNENWYGYEKQEDGSLISYTDFLVDGETMQQYQIQTYIIDVMDDDAAKQAFLKGELSEWIPSTDDLVTYNLSDRLYKADLTYTYRFFFNTNLEALQGMDAAQGNTNSVVMSNENFRKAFSLCIDRSEWVTATAGYKPAFYLINSLYYYNIFEDPTSSFRSSDAAKAAICDLYGIEYGEGTIYATLDDAYASVTGYNLTEAKELMKQACEELVAAGLYNEGEDIKIRIGWAAGSIDDAANKQCTLIQGYLNAALEGSGFGTITLEPVGNLANRYSDVANGLYAIGFGAWGGAAFYPFTMFRVYMDPDYTSVHEIGCYDPTTETLTLNIQGEDVTMTWQEWSNATSGTGIFADTDNEVKLEVTAKLEEAFLQQYYCIPLAALTECTMFSYQVQRYTENYNTMYEFGDIRLTTFNYSDAEWAEFVASQGGTISYE